MTIKVVPYAAGGHTGLLGAFILADLNATQSILFLDDASGGRVAEDAPVVSDMALLFDALRSDALPKVASRDLIVKAVKERWTA